jgi:hypothetical protein
MMKVWFRVDAVGRVKICLLGISLYAKVSQLKMEGTGR